MTEKRYKLIESDPCEDPYDCRMYVGILEDDVEELYDYKSICDRLNELVDEIEQLKSRVDYLDRSILTERSQIVKLQRENEQLKQRNNRQAKQLDRLYNLIEEKDWRTLTDIIDDFKRCEEQLQREWKCYDD